MLEKALKMGKVSATGGFQLFVGVAMSSAMMAVGTIILARLRARGTAKLGIVGE